MDDIQIVALYWARDPRAIDETAGKYEPFLTAIARNILRSTDDAEECVNDTYLHTWNAIPPSRPEKFRAWLGRVARNLSLDRWKARQAEKRGGDETTLLLGELSDCLPGSGGPEEDLAEQELAAAISRFLRGISRENRVMFLRRYWFGDSIADLAAATGWGQSRVKSALFRTRNALRKHLEKEGFTP